MKTITVSDEDYEILMDLSTQLQKQPNHGQAFPYFWEPSSEHLVPNIHGEGTETGVFYDGERTSLKDIAEDHDDLWHEFCVLQEYKPDTEFCETDKTMVEDWANWLTVKHNHAIIITEDWKAESEHNPSLFLDDVKEYIDSNKHHLGRNPTTYARTFCRMSRMEKLVKVLYRLNQETIDQINPAAKLHVGDPLVELADLVCPAGHKVRLSIYASDPFRTTYCAKCGQGRIFKRVIP